MSDGTAGMREAESGDPGFVYRNGWTHFECGDCHEVIYDGRWISSEDTEELKRIHRAACTG
ncbi:hypothetical protein AB0M45_18135 [Nocardia sp. NPDC051787]|uniref:hypothetical protein n=1 Tax=Nocardia sp. NPDC051787 TaxID=3155415 RepID=UPI0034145796